MDVDYSLFWPQLLPILRSISKATFVAFDVEMSGIALRSRGGSNDRSLNVGKPTLQQQYEETKEAAETYQVLQIGITCVEEDRERNMYIAKPYNFNVSPLFLQKDKLGINRDITFSSSAIQFLMDNSFNIGAVFNSGVSYLSHDEENTAHEKYRERTMKNAQIPDIVIAPGDVEVLDFYRKARDTISEWANQKKKELEFVNIGTPRGLNSFQRRLVHQLVRTEFPAYRTFARNRGDFMQVEKINPAKEAQIEKTRLAAFEADIARQTGLRFIFDALTGGDLSTIDPSWFLADAGKPAVVNLAAKSKEVEEIQEALKAKEHTVVGHNLFTDLVFLYRTFVGPLPDEVSDFKQEIRGLFPHVIDTKYMATQAGGPMQATSSLKELCEQCKAQTKPFICLAEDHVSYSARGKDHEAGYDSWMTAQVFTKFSTRLDAEQKELLVDDSSSSDIEMEYASATEEAYSISDDDGALLNPPDTNLSSHSSVLLFKGRNRNDENAKHSMMTSTKSGFSTRNVFSHLADEGDEDSSSTISSPDKDVPGRPGGALLYSPTRSSKSSKRSPRSPLASNPFSLLDADMDAAFRSPSEKESPFSGPIPGHGSDVAVSKNASNRVTNQHLLPQWYVAQLNPSTEDEDKGKDGVRLKQWIPGRKDKFWRKYSNKLRVYGTESGVCDLEQ